MASRIRLFSSTPRRRRSQAGFALIETLIFVPTIFIMTFLTIEVTNIMRVNEKLSWVAENSVRQGSEGMDGGYRKGGITTSKTADDMIEELGLYNSIDYWSVLLNTHTGYCSHDDDCEDKSNWHVPSSDKEGDNFVEGDLVRVTVAGKYKPFLAITERFFPDLMIKKTFTRVISRPLPPD